jgi:hypothetical protein
LVSLRVVCGTRVEYTTCYFEGGRVKTPVYQLSDLGADDIVEVWAAAAAAGGEGGACALTS